MILVADGGSSKTDWIVVEKDINHFFHTKGINPFHNSEDQIIKEIHSSDLIKFREHITEINFYGAGLASKEIKDDLSKIFNKLFPFTQRININDDLIAAARALFAEGKGIACILGTGSNSCFFNGQEVVDKVPALGYVLGDEGSGAYMGIRFINAYFKREFSEELINILSKENDLQMNSVLENVYKKPLPSRYLASYTKILKKYEEHAEIHKLIKNSFLQFIDKNVSRYPDSILYPIGFVGSIAFYFKDILEEALKERGLQLGKVIKAPIEELITYHSLKKRN